MSLYVYSVVGFGLELPSISLREEDSGPKPAIKYLSHTPTNHNLETVSSMDPPLIPPLRLQPILSSSITTRSAQKLMESFLDDFQARTTVSHGGNTAVTVQLQKLADALKEERKLRKKEGGH